MKLNETKMLGLSSKKDRHMLALEVLSENKKLTKQRTLQKLASIYDPIGIILPTTITGKIVYHDLWDFKISWDKALPDWVVKKLEKW